MPVPAQLICSNSVPLAPTHAEPPSFLGPAGDCGWHKEFIQVESEGGNTTIAIDLDGAHHETEVKQSEDDKNPITVVTGDKYQYSDVITLDNVTSTLDDLLKNQQIIY